MTQNKSALVVVDLQNDFMPSGALPVKCGDEVVAIANHVMPFFALVVASQDWHPKNHGSFASQHQGNKPGDHTKLAGMDQVLWPDHCVQNSEGASLVANLNKEHIAKVFHKGTDPQIDSYSTFFDNAHKRATGLNEYLAHQGVKNVYVMGLITDYCVKFSALDALHLGYETFVIIDGCRGGELLPGDTARALEEMKQAGVHLITSTDIKGRIP